MTGQENRPLSAAELRKQAEDQVREKATQTVDKLDHLTPAEIGRIVHELRVHQAELEMQNEELRSTHAELDLSRARYFDLFDLAPVGYCILNDKGLVQEANLTAAMMLGVPRGVMIRQLLSHYILKEDQDVYYLHYRRLLKTGEPQVFEVRMLDFHGNIIWVSIKATGSQVDQPNPDCRLVLTDISERKRAEEDLRLFKAIIEKSQEAIAVSDAQGRLVYINPAHEQLFGWPLAEAQKRDYHELYPPASIELMNLAVTPAISRGESWQGELNVFDARGREFPLWQRADALRDRQGNFLFGFGLMHDVSERRLVDETQAFLLQCGLPATGEDFFASLARYLAEVLGMGYVCIDYLEPDNLTAQTVAIYNAGKLESNVRYTLKDTPCGDVVDKSVCCFPRGVRFLFPHDAALQELNAESYLGTMLLDSKGHPIGLIAVIGQNPLQDTKQAEMILQLVAPRTAGELERRQTEYALRESEAKYRLIVENQRDLLIKTDVERRLLFVNPASCGFLAKTEGQLLGGSIVQFVHPEDQTAADAAFEVLSQPPHECVYEERIHARDGWRWVNWAAKAVLDEHGVVTGMISSGRDVTDRKQAEAKINDQLEELKRWYHVTLGREDRIMELKRQVNRLLAESGRPPLYASSKEAPHG